jgi:hypothetical protein
MIRPVLLCLVATLGCGQPSTRPAECKAFSDAFHTATPRIATASEAVARSGGDRAALIAAMQAMEGTYRALEEEVVRQPVLDEQLKLRIDAYLDVVRQTRASAATIAQATPETEVYRLNEAQIRLQELARKEKSTVAEITDYCSSGT